MEFVTKYYLKELASQKLYIKSTGAPAPFELVEGDNGILATDNPAYTSELDIAAKKGIGGVVPISKETYDELKKKSQEQPSLGNLVRDQRFSLSSLNLPIRPNVAVAGVEIHGQLPDTPKSEPIAIPTTFQRPKTAKGFQVKKTEE